jgi:hypothetical protein
MARLANELPWVGWVSPTRGRWLALVQAESYDACVDMLLAVWQSNGNLVVLPGGRHPSDRQARSSRGAIRGIGTRTGKATNPR